MDKNNKSYLMISAFLSALLLSAVGVLIYIYRISSIRTYQQILLAIILLAAGITLFFLLSMASVYIAFKKRHIGRFLLFPARLGLKVFLPFSAFMADTFKGDKDTIRRYYVEVNNILTQTSLARYAPHEVMILLPHCLQYAECSYKVTSSIDNCRACGKCRIGEIARLASETGVKSFIATGGTVARKIVARERPKVILSVACERDLMSGIADVEGIPVLGVINERPNGPCYNTTVDMALFRQKLNSLLK